MFSGFVDSILSLFTDKDDEEVRSIESIESAVSYLNDNKLRGITIKRSPSRFSHDVLALVCAQLTTIADVCSFAMSSRALYHAACVGLVYPRLINLKFGAYMSSNIIQTRSFLENEKNVSMEEIERRKRVFYLHARQEYIQLTITKRIRGGFEKGARPRRFFLDVHSRKKTIRIDSDDDWEFGCINIAKHGAVFIVRHRKIPYAVNLDGNDVVVDKKVQALYGGGKYTLGGIPVFLLDWFVTVSDLPAHLTIRLTGWNLDTSCRTFHIVGTT